MPDLWVLVLPPILLTVVIFDLRYRIIPNLASLVIAAAFVPHALVALSMQAALLALAAATLVLFGMSILFSFRLIGGGDVKLLGACTLWAGWADCLDLLGTTAVIGGILALATLGWKAVGPAVRASDVRGAHEQSVPYGVAIALAALWVVATTSPGVS